MRAAKEFKMGMLSRLRERLDATFENRGGAESERFAFSAELPAGARGPICRVNVQVLVEPQQDGDRVRVRAHLQSNLASVLRPALRAESEAEPAVSSSRSLVQASGQRMSRVAGNGLQRVLASRVVSRITEPLLRRDFNTWVEVQASTEPLHDGAHSIVPQQDKLAALGIRPSKGRSAVAESWSGHTPTGFAQLSLLQIDKKDLPPDLVRRMGPRPFQLAAAIVNTVERK